MKDLRDALVLITGAGRGIGHATALRFAREGARVLCVDIQRDSAEKAAAACAEAGACDATAYAVDVSDAQAVQALAERVHADHGVLDVLVNNAGVGMAGRLQDMTIDHWNWIRSINLDGVVYCCHAFGPAMVERGSGHVVNLSSGLGYTPRATEPAYVATKAAVLALSLSLRADWEPRGVGVRAICPGIIDTPIVEHTPFVGLDAEDHARAKRLFRRGHSPDKVAKAIVRSVRRNRLGSRAVTPVGVEAKAGWLLHRFGPLSMQQRVARQEMPDVGGQATAGRPETVLERSETFRLDTDDGATIAGEIAGTGPTVVLAHCWTGSRAVWQDVAQQLVASGHRVVLYDHRGHAASSSGTGGHTLERLADDLRAVLEHVDARDATLAGHSLGGMTIQQLALRHPVLVEDRVAAIVLVATSARGIATQRLGKIAERVIAGVITQRLMSSRRGTRFVRGAFGRTPDQAHLIATRELFAECDPKVRAEILGVMLAMDLRGLAKLDVPVTVVAGERDGLTRPLVASEIAQRLGAELHVLEGAGHMLPYERPAELVRLLATRS